MARREKGTGGLYFDKEKARHIGEIRIDGRRRRVSGRTKTEARAKLVAAKATGTPVADRLATVDRALMTFLDRELPSRAQRRGGLAPSTLSTYEWSARVLSSEFGGARLHELSTAEVEQALDRIAARHQLASSSMVKVRSTLVQAFDMAVARGEAIRNPAKPASCWLRSKASALVRCSC